jgi:tetrahydromethanopterin S-methyltransferase subunit G
MEAMRQSWTDDRLDDFRGETQRRFDEVDKRFDEVDKRFDKVEGEIKDLGTEMNARFDSLQRTMLWFSGALIVALIVCLVSQAWFVATQV